MNFFYHLLIMTVELSYTVYVWLVPFGLSFLYSFSVSLLLYHREVYFSSFLLIKPFLSCLLSCSV
ncbi:hypothetical protein BO83DRAFT_114048 [Aspergillus eucalypticola CBS 122712]|uniref:Uncharacterized protein n=1 Tax=Aspergillus eucalypticola (strain CBS 122712 / IBT 29274) TaxID=1448314 RepID=A0A317V0G9_ASPEC|nr:uncharacterized protein BO83DRAFT_114048 [Aspergillus eucalypticola CBS 122712]PWY66292.1 hypothetical protein BO83DRAFT_114048 [Aspergillus eucalypticola CBS 122712]